MGRFLHFLGRGFLTYIWNADSYQQPTKLTLRLFATLRNLVHLLCFILLIVPTGACLKKGGPIGLILILLTLIAFLLANSVIWNYKAWRRYGTLEEDYKNFR